MKSNFNNISSFHIKVELVEIKAIMVILCLQILKNQFFVYINLTLL